MKCYWHEFIRSTTLLSSWSVSENIFFFPTFLTYSPPCTPSFFSPFSHLLLDSFHPVASTAIGRFKWLLTGSAGDLWLHLSLTWNPLPSGPFFTSWTYSNLLPFIVLSTLSLSFSSIFCDIISFSSVCLSVFIYFFIIRFFISLMHLPLVISSAEQVEDRRLRKRKGAKKGAMKSLLCGITDYRPTDRPNQSGRREEWVSTQTHTVKTLWRTESNHPRGTEHSILSVK